MPDDDDVLFDDPNPQPRKKLDFDELTPEQRRHLNDHPQETYRPNGNGDDNIHQLRPFQFSPFVLRDPKLIPPRQWLYGRHLIRRFVSTTIAPGGLGKSSLLLVEALAMVSGKPLLGVPVRERLRVWAWNGEDPMDELERRIGGAVIRYGLTAADLDGHLFVDSGRTKPLIIATEDRKGLTIHEPLKKELIAAIRAHKIDVVVVDPFVSSHQVSENDNGAIDSVTKTWADIADVTDTAIELVHHVRKTPPGIEITVEDSRGAGAMNDASRSTRVLNRMTPLQGAEFAIKDPQSYFRLTDGKSNLARQSKADTWFCIQSVKLGNGQAGLAGDEVGVVTPWQPPDAMEGVTVETLGKVIAACRGKVLRADTRSTEWIGVPIGYAMGLDVGPVLKQDRTEEQNANRRKVERCIATWLTNEVFVPTMVPDERGREKAGYVVRDQ